MSTIVTRADKGTPLTNAEVDANFINLNTDKYQSGDNVTFTTLTATGQTSLGGAAGSESFRVVPTASAVNYWQATGGTTTNFALLNATGGDTNVSGAFVSKGTGSLLFSTNGFSSNNQMRVSHTSNAVNYVEVTGAATGQSASITFTGSDSSVGGLLTTKSGGDLLLQTGGSGGYTYLRPNSISTLRAVPTASGVNYFQVAAGITGNAAVLSTSPSSDTNAAMALQSKGTGAIDLAAGSSGVNISNGTTVTAITRTATNSNYTSAPTIAIAAPTTAGGVQATATCSIGMTLFPINGGGTGYTVGDVLTMVGGTFTTAARVTVSAVSGGVITAVTGADAGVYTVAPTNPVSVTGGTGTGATFNCSFAVNTAFTITNAGSGYIEQPTVTFSGGGGSGAAAYATVGSETNVRSLGNQLSFRTPGGEQVRIIDGSTTSLNYVFLGASSGGDVSIGGNGSSTNVNILYRVRGTAGAHRFFTNDNNNEQFRVAGTASAVNYVQVTGAATGGNVNVSAQGSDSNIGITYQGKGAGSSVMKGDGGVFFQNNAGNNLFSVETTASSVNRLTATGGAAGDAPKLFAQGSDTNIGLNLTTKGTGSISLQTGNGLQLRVNDTFGTVTSANWWEVSGRGAGSAPLFGVAGETNTSAIFYVKGTGAQRFATGAGADNGNGAVDQFRIAHTASAVNYVQVTGAATLGIPTISMQGSDSNITMRLQYKGNGGIQLSNAAGWAGLTVTAANNPNSIALNAPAAGSAPTLTAQGSDTDIDLALTPKGTGVVRIGNDPILTTTAATSTYQPILVSGTNIKTINGTSLLGSGDVTISAGVSSFNTRTGAITLSSADVTTALGYTPPQPTGTGASGTWGISITGNAATTTVATTATITTSSTAGAFKIPFANTTASTTGNYDLLQDSAAEFTYNPSTNTLAVGVIDGATINGGTF